MSTEETTPGAVPLDGVVRHCWPTPWLEAAVKAGFANCSGGQWVFINDQMRDMLAEFGAAVRDGERERIACQWDGCTCEVFCEGEIDIGAAIRGA